MNDQQPEFHPLSLGIAEAVHGEDASAKVEEAADVKRWLKRISDAREFDKAIRTQYARDRRYARGDKGDFEIGVPICGSFIEVLCSMLYAKDPDMDATPADTVKPPSMAELMDQVRDEVLADPAVLQQAQQAGMAVGQQAAQAALQEAAQSAMSEGGKPGEAAAPIDPAAAAQQAMQDTLNQAVKARARELVAPYMAKQKDTRQFTKTLEIVLSRVWKSARLKDQMDAFIRSGLTVGVAWLKATWQEQRGEDPIIRQKIAGIQDNLRQYEALQAEVLDGTAPDVDAAKAELTKLLVGLEAQVEVVVARGMAFDFFPAEDVQVATEVQTIAQYRDAPWLATRTFMPTEAAKARFPHIKDKIKNASLYSPVKPTDPSERRESGGLAEVSAEDADAFKLGGGEHGHVCAWEVQDRDTNTVFVVIEGLDCYAVPPQAPSPPTSRFYSLFLWAPTKVDGERHPQSLVSRTADLFDEYNRTRSNKAEHRRRAIPKLGFDATNYSPEEIKKLESGATGEMVGLKPIRPGEKVADAVAPIAYNQVDAALYETAEIRAEVEMIWGIQEARASMIRTAKTATEAEIQESGTEARSDYKVDQLDTMLSELAVCTAEVATQKMSRTDVVDIAGEWAFWPEGMTVEDLATLANIKIRAGSSGKPDTSADRQAWTNVLPVLESAIEKVAALRGSDPASVADCIEEVVATTLDRFGIRVDVGQFLPAAPSATAASVNQPPEGAIP